MTNKEFKNLNRNEDGDIINLSETFIFLTPTQIDKLSEDDWSRYHSLNEELGVLLHDAELEFC